MIQQQVFGVQNVSKRSWLLYTHCIWSSTFTNAEIYFYHNSNCLSVISFTNCKDLKCTKLQCGNQISKRLDKLDLVKFCEMIKSFLPHVALSLLNNVFKLIKCYFFRWQIHLITCEFIMKTLFFLKFVQIFFCNFNKFN